MVMRVILLISIFLGLGLTAEAVPEKSAIAVPETVVATPPPVILPAVAPLTATPPPVIPPIASQAAGPETISYATVTIENPAARVVISTQRASIDRFELKASHPIKLPRHLHRNDDESIGLPVQSDPNGKKIKPPLAVLSAFSVESSTEATRLAKNQHHWLSNDSETALAWGIRGNETSPWTIASRSPEAATLTWSNGRGLMYAVTYRLHATLAQLAVQVAVTNNGTTPVALKPAVTLINGIHQDYAPNEAAYMVAFTHRGGDQDGTIETTSVPATDKGWATVANPDPKVDFVGVKSRFFAVWWRPGQVAIAPVAPGSPAAPAPVVPVAAGPEAAPPANGPLGGPSAPDSTTAWRADISGFTTQRHQDHQGRLNVSFGAIQVPAGRTLDANWTVSASGMSNADLKTLSPAEQRIELTDAMHKFFIFPTRLLTMVLGWIVMVVPNYAVAVILLTLLVKAALFRLTWKQHSSMIKMQKLAPELKYIQEQYKTDKAKLAQKQMELWKKNGVNPLGGCLPLLIQMPIFIALYQTFQYNADMRGASFLWVSDLTLPDQVWGMPLAFLHGWVLSLNPLPLIYIAVTIWMGLTTPIPVTAAGGDPMQEQMAKSMRWMPVLFGLIFYNMPAGLVLYFTVNAVISTIEVKFIRRRLAA